MSNEAFGPVRQNSGNLFFQSWQISRYSHHGRVVGRGFPLLEGSGGAGFDLRFNFSPSARCAFRDGDGPRTFGFSMGKYRLAGPGGQLRWIIGEDERFG